MKSIKLIHRFLFVFSLAVALNTKALPLPPGAGGPPPEVDPNFGIRAKAEIENYLQGILRDYKLPNIAVQLVGPQGPLWQITLGYRDLQTKLPVTNQTLYAIGSTTKAFTGLLMMQLEEQGRLNIDDPVQKYRSDFGVSNPQYSATLTLRDLMTHSTGVGRHDLAWYHRSASREELFALIPHLEMEAEPRTQFIYNNWMWLGTGLVAEKVTGKTWETLIRERLFAPLGMSSSVLSVAEVRQSRDYALPYEVSPLGVNEVPFYDIAAMNPAGGIYSNLQDLAQWLRLHLNGGQLDSKRVISKAALEESYRGIQSMGGKAKYALGWATLPMSGYRFLTHDGGIDGFTSNISLLPDQGLGVVVLMNASSISAESIASRIWQHVLNLPLTDMVRENTQAMEKYTQEQMRLYPDEPQVPLVHPLSDYAGSYCHPAYPEVTITEAIFNNELMLNLSAIRVSAYPISENAFSIRGQYDAKKIIRFERDSDGRVKTLKWLQDFTKCR